MRSGLIAKKVGMTRVYTDSGEHVPVTVLQLHRNQVVAHRTEDKDGYTAVQVGSGSVKVKNTTRAMRGHFAKANVEPKRKLAEFCVSPENLVAVGAEPSHRDVSLRATGGGGGVGDGRQGGVVDAACARGLGDRCGGGVYWWCSRRLSS